MKKILFIFLSLFILNGCTKNEPFYLNDEYYEKSEFVEIDNTKLKELENAGESFALVVYNSSCIGSANFIKLINEYLENNEIKIYRILGKNTNDTLLSKKIKFFPSMVIYKDGKIIEYLDTELNEHIKYYENLESFEEWFESIILMK